MIRRFIHGSKYVWLHRCSLWLHQKIETQSLTLSFTNRLAQNWHDDRRIGNSFWSCYMCWPNEWIGESLLKRCQIWLKCCLRPQLDMIFILITGIADELHHSVCLMFTNPRKDRHCKMVSLSLCCHQELIWLHRKQSEWTFILPHSTAFGLPIFPFIFDYIPVFIW